MERGHKGVYFGQEEVLPWNKEGPKWRTVHGGGSPRPVLGLEGVFCAALVARGDVWSVGAPEGSYK